MLANANSLPRTRGQLTAPGQLAASPNFINELQLQHGPIAELGEFFLAANRAALQRGVTLSFAPLFDLIVVQRLLFDRLLGCCFSADLTVCLVS